MTLYNAVHRKFQAKIKRDGSVLVSEASKHMIEGCVYFSCKSKAFKVATDLLIKGLITPKRSGFMVTPRGFMDTEGFYYLGAVILSKPEKETDEHEEERAKSKLIHGVSYARS